MSFLEDTLTGPSPATPSTSFLFSPIISFPLQTPWVAFLKAQWPAHFLLPTSQKTPNLNDYAWPLNKFCNCLGDISIALLLSLQVPKNLKQVLTYSFSLNWFPLPNWRPPNSHSFPFLPENFDPAPSPLLYPTTLSVIPSQQLLLLSSSIISCAPSLVTLYMMGASTKFLFLHTWPGDIVLITEVLTVMPNMFCKENTGLGFCYHHFYRSYYPRLSLS